MSKKCVDLVIGLRPPKVGARYQITSPGDSRTRFMLFVLAYLADDAGRCSATNVELAAYMALLPSQVSEVRKRLVEDGLVEVERSPHSAKPAVYRLAVDELESRQMDVLAREKGSVFVLEEYGASPRALNALARCEVEDMAALTEEIERYQKYPTGARPGFDAHLVEHRGVRNFGPRSAFGVLEAFARWRHETQG